MTSRANIPSLLPPDFFVITNNVEEIKLDTLLDKLLMEKSMIEIELQLDGKYSLYMMGEKIDTENIGLKNYFLLTSQSVKVCKIIT